MTDRFTDRLSEYVDDELTLEERELVEGHVGRCAECAGLVRDLQAVRTRAAALPDRRTADDLWPGIEARIRGARTTTLGGRGVLRRRIALTVPQLAAAGLTLASLSAAGAWMALGGSGTPETAVPAGPEASASEAILAADGGDAESADRYAAAITELEAALFEGDVELPPETAARVRRALTTIDRALEDARRALDRAPGDPYLRQHVTNTMRRKAEFLRNAVRLSQS